MVATSCPICSSESVKTIYRVANDYLTGTHFQVWGCNDCSVVYTFPQPENLNPHYPEKYRKYNPVTQTLLEALYKIRALFWSKKDSEPGVAFEVGCGNGIMLHTLYKNGWKVFANERTLNAAYFAHQTLNLPIYVGGIEPLQPAPTADLIILFQVLEHLDKPLVTLRQLHNLLKPNGKIIIAVPNFKSWQSKFSKEKWFHLDVPRHLYHFSLPSLEYCLRHAGYRISNVKYVSFEHDPFGWIQSVLNRLSIKQNFLTRVLMGIEKLSVNSVLQILLAILIGILSLPLVLLSWLMKNGAIIEVTAIKSNTIANEP